MRVAFMIEMNKNLFAHENGLGFDALKNDYPNYKGTEKKNRDTSGPRTVFEGRTAR